MKLRDVAGAPRAPWEGPPPALANSLGHRGSEVSGLRAAVPTPLGTQVPAAPAGLATTPLPDPHWYVPPGAGPPPAPPAHQSPSTVRPLSGLRPGWLSCCWGLSPAMLSARFLSSFIQLKSLGEGEPQPLQAAISSARTHQLQGRARRAQTPACLAPEQPGQVNPHWPRLWAQTAPAVGSSAQTGPAAQADERTGCPGAGPGLREQRPFGPPSSLLSAAGTASGTVPAGGGCWSGLPG